MGQIITSTAIEDLKSTLPVNTAIKGVEESDVTEIAEEDFASLHALFENEYEQLLKDIDDEIAKISQK